MAIAPAFATHDATAEADSSASTAKGDLFEAIDLDTGACTAIDTAATETGTVSGRCGDGLNLNDQIKAFSQNASAPGDGTSAADASVAPIDIVDFGALRLRGIVEGLGAADTGTVLDGLVNPAGQGIKELLTAAGLYDTAVAEIDAAVQEALASVHDELPLSLEIGAVESWCKATAQPLNAEGNSTVARIDLLIRLGDQVIRVPITIESAPNSDLIVHFPQDAVDGIIDGLRATFNESLDGSAAGINDILDPVQEQLTDQLFAELEAELLPSLSDGLAQLIKGTVNKQEPVSPSSTGEIEVTALELILGGEKIGELDLARSHCGPNRAGTAHGDAPGATPEPQQQPGPAPGPGAADIPTQVDSGQSGSNSTAILMGTGALLLAAGATGLAGYRRMLQQ